MGVEDHNSDISQIMDGTIFGESIYCNTETLQN